MQEIKIEFNSAGFKEILCSEGVKSLVESTTSNIRNKANANYGGDGFESDVWLGDMMSKYAEGGRWLGTVYASDRASKIAESEDKALSRAVN